MNSFFANNILPFILAGYAISILVVVILIVLENRSPLKTISWVLVLLMLPGLGFILYIFFGQNFRKEKIIARKGLRNHHRINYLAHSQITQLADGSMGGNDIAREPTGIVRLLLNNSSEPFDGQMDEVMVYGRSLTAAEIVSPGSACSSAASTSSVVRTQPNLSSKFFNVAACKSGR